MTFENTLWKRLKKLNKDTNMKIARRTLGIGIKHMYALNDGQGQIINSIDELIKVAEEFYTKLYSIFDRQTKDSSMEVMKFEVLCVNASEIKKA